MLRSDHDTGWPARPDRGRAATGPPARILYSPRVPSRNPRATRRAVLVAGTGAGAALLAGCGRASAPTGAGAEPTAPAVDADSDLVEQVGAAIEAAAATATAVARQHPGHRALGRRLAALHRAHLAELGRGRVGAAPAARLPAARAREHLLRVEAELERHLGRAAVEAESGALAQVFAAMAAALAQQRAVTA